MKEYLFKIDENTTVAYLISPAHRKAGNSHKSVWIISFDDEFGCFCFSYSNGWIESDDAWGYYLDKYSQLVILGIGVNKEELKLARFKKDPTAAQWHGYPCNYMANSYDVPPETILKKWVLKGAITKAKMSKIQRSLSCSL